MSLSTDTTFPTCDIRVTTKTPDRILFPMMEGMEATMKVLLEPAMSLGHLFRNREPVSRWIVAVVGMRKSLRSHPSYCRHGCNDSGIDAISTKHRTNWATHASSITKI